jgi:hypothetical protein
MAMQEHYRAYSTDSMNSDSVFTDEPYQGRLRSMDHRKG